MNQSASTESKEVPKDSGKKRLFGVHIGFGKKKKQNDKPKDTAVVSQPKATSSAATGTTNSKNYDHHTNNDVNQVKSEYGDLGGLLDVNEDELSGIVNESFLQKVRKQVVSSRTHLDTDQQSIESGTEAGDSKEELFVSEYTKEWMRMEDAREKKGKQEKKSMPGTVSVADSFPLMNLNLPTPLSRPLTERVDKDSGISKASWIAPDSWVVSNEATMSDKSILDTRKMLDEPMSCIRVFKREGNFATVSCAISITAKDLCTLLAKKFFVQNEVTSKFQLWLIRRGTERLMEPNDRPLRIQQQFLYEIGYDQDCDKYPEILREDNSYLFRWVYSDSGMYSSNYSQMLSLYQMNSSMVRTQALAPNEQRMLELIKISQEETQMPNMLDLTLLNIDTIPVVMFKYAKMIRQLTLSYNIMLDIPQDFAQLCIYLTSLTFRNVQLQRVPKAISLFTALEHLDLANNLITTVKESGMEALKRLRVLNLRNNRFLARNSLPIEILGQWTTLESLDLSCNWIRGECPPSLLFIGSGFSSLPEAGEHFTFVNPLIELDLSYNLIKSLPPNFNKHLQKLKRFWIVANNLQKLPQVEDLSDLELLDVRGNSLREIPGFCEEPVKVDRRKSVALASPLPLASSTGVKYSQTFSMIVPEEGEAIEENIGAKPLRRLLLDNNQISGVKISTKLPKLSTIVSHRNPNLLQISFAENLPSLTTMVISSSKLAFLPDDLFQWAPNLQVLVLNHNQISTLPLSLQCLKNLVCLELAHNTLNKLPSFIRELKSLELMDVRGNNLKDLPGEIWEMRVKYLNLSSNLLENFPENPYTTIISGGNSTISGDVSVRQSLFSNKNTAISMSGLPSLLENQKLDEGLVGQHQQSLTSSYQTGNLLNHYSSASSLLAPLSSTLLWLSVADNRIETPFFETAVQHFFQLKSLNCAHNELFAIPAGTMRNCAQDLEELYLSGNHLTQLPEELHTFKSLRRLYLNNNRLGSLPPELGKIPNLRVLDVGRNQLRYIGNWPYDWNWNWNTELRYLNFSGNPRLEIRPIVVTQTQTSAASGASGGSAGGALGGGKKDKNKGGAVMTGTNISPMVVGDTPNEILEKGGDISRFDQMTKMRILGLMEVSVLVPVPDEQRQRRVRVHALGGASAHWRKQIAGTDALTSSVVGSSGVVGNSSNISATEQTSIPAAAIAKTSDLANQKDFNPQGVIGPAVMVGPTAGTPLSAQPQVDGGLNVQPQVSYGISDDLGTHEKSTCWDLVVLGGRFFQIAKEDAKMAGEGGDTTNLRNLRKIKAGECVFGLFDGGKGGGNSCSKFLYDSFVYRFAAELKKVVKERQSKLMKDQNGVDAEPELSDSFAKATDSVLIQHALRRTFLLINKQLGELSWKTEFKQMNKEQKDQQIQQPSVDSNPRARVDTAEQRRKYSVSFETPLQGKIKKGKKLSVFDETSRTIKRKFSIPDASSVTTDAKPQQTQQQNSQPTQQQPLPQKHEDYQLIDSDSDDEDDDDQLLSEDTLINLAENGHSGLIAYMVNTQLFIANCGDTMAVLCRNGVAVPLSMKHSLFSFQASSSHSNKQQQQAQELQQQQQQSQQDPPIATTNLEKDKVMAKQEHLAKRELHRIRETGAYVTHDGLICENTILSRAFGYFHLLPHINACPNVSVTDLTDQDEFLIIATGSFWNTINYQTAVDVARLKAEDALEASMVLRDFAVAYSNKYSFFVDDLSIFPEEKYRIKKRLKNQNERKPLRYRSQDAMTVMVINLRDWLGGKQRKVFSKVKRRRDETVDSGIARLAPEIEPPTGFVTIVFTDVRNSTMLWEKKPIAMRVAIREHNQIMRRNLRTCHGYEVKTEGDAFMVSFKNVFDALRWCITVQTQLLEADWPQEILESADGQDVFGPSSLSDKGNGGNDVLLYRGLCIRMGVHCGTPVSEVDPITRRMDYFGPMVNKTSRICGAAEGGQILVSQDVEKTFRKMKHNITRTSNTSNTTAQPSDDNSMQRQPSLKRTTSNSERIGSLMALDPVFINIGERKLKGFENPEPVISVFPKVLVGRHKVPPPNVPEQQPQKPIISANENQLSIKESLSSFDTKGSESSFPEVLTTSNTFQSLQNPDTRRGSRRASLQPVSGLAEKKPSAVKETYSDGHLSSLDEANERPNSITDSILEDQPQKDYLSVPEDRRLSKDSARLRRRTEDSSSFAEFYLLKICDRLETAALALIKNMISSLEDPSKVSSVAETKINNRLSMFCPTEEVLKMYNDKRFSVAIPQSISIDDSSLEKIEKYLVRLERVSSTISSLFESSIVQNLALAGESERHDFLEMLKFLLSMIPQSTSSTGRVSRRLSRVNDSE